MSAHFLGLRTVKYRAPDIKRARDWYTEVLGFGPYFDEPFYVGFSVGGFELGLDPDLSEYGGGEANPDQGGVTVYWGVAHAGASLARLLGLGAVARSPVQDVGGGIKVATVFDPFGNVLGIIENPHFQYQPPPQVHAASS
jgi:catechol 2,3-dioxygenase-like lactoylglutathione lyase family enzyme